MGRIFWPSTRGRTHFRRLKLLVDGDYLRTLCGDRGVRLGLVLTKKGARAATSPGKTSIPEVGRRPRYRSTYDHDMLLRRLCELITSSPAVSQYQAEAELRRRLAAQSSTSFHLQKKFKVPDAMFKLNAEDQNLKVALELEIAQKSAARYREMVRRLLLDDKIDAVFFVVASATVANRLRHTIDALDATDPLARCAHAAKGCYFVNLSDVLKQGLEAPFSGEGSAFRLSDFNRRRDN